MSKQILRLQQVIGRTGLSRSTIYKLIGENRFPRPVKLTHRTIGWDEMTIDQWIEERLAPVQQD